MLISSKLSIRNRDRSIEILHSEHASPVMSFTPGIDFIVAAHAEGAIKEVIDSSGLPRHGQYPLDYCLEENVLERFETTPEWQLLLRPAGFEVRGILRSARKAVNYTATFDVVSEDELTFDIRVDAPEINRVEIRFKSPSNENIFGLGEQFSFLDLKGHRVPLYVMEKGIGRGLEPLTSFIDLAPFPASMEPFDALVPEFRTESHYGSHSYGTYIPIPFFLTNLGRALMLDNCEFSTFDFRAPDRVAIEVWAPKLRGRIFLGRTPKELLERYTAYAGRMRPMPSWVVDGMMIGAGGGSEVVRKTIRQAIESYAKLGISVTSVNIHDWQGRRAGDIFIPSRLWWTFEPDATLYPDWEAMVREFRDQGIRVVTYFNPMIATEAGEQKSNLKNDLFTLAREAGFLVTRTDGAPYVVSSGIVKAAFVDLTNPAAREWFKDLMKAQVRVGISGWMSDFAEGLPHDAVLFSGEDAASYHNRYPVEFAKLNQEVIAELGMEDEINFHSRSGYSFSSKYSTGFFTGDQLNTWDDYGGFKTTVTALISGGLSGIQFFIYTYGAFWTIVPEEIFPKLPDEVVNRVPADLIPELRADLTPELRTRRLELVAFGAYAMMGPPKPDEQFACFATIVNALVPYRKGLGIEASEFGLPLIRHMMLEFPEDPEVYSLRYQYMYGGEILFRPVVDPGVTEVQVYLPAGYWKHLFSGEVYGSSEGGSWVEVDAPLGRPAVFYRPGSEVGASLEGALQAGNFA
jgi:alpha-glucosidase